MLKITEKRLEKRLKKPIIQKQGNKKINKKLLKKKNKKANKKIIKKEKEPKYFTLNLINSFSQKIKAKNQDKYFSSSFNCIIKSANENICTYQSINQFTYFKFIILNIKQIIKQIIHNLIILHMHYIHSFISHTLCQQIQLSTCSAPNLSFSSQFQRKRPKVKNLTICKISAILEKIQENSSAIPHYNFQKHKMIVFDLEEDLQKLKLTQQDIYTQNNLVSIKEFLYKIQSNLKCPDEYFVAAFLLILKYLSLSSIQFTENNCQRLIACAIMLIEKQYSDYILSLYAYSRGVNIPVKDLQEMELQFLSTINWEINIKEEEFQAFQEYFNTISA
ncbi:amine-terminal domain cyclin (macronuclear) [Tetrahymena thermophila SB210]|uniref:Amine-terminal domain cyclin n=1 Tax=Tetrahymena thermophila (strain SB210) TaxID=312017 RepID=Q22RT1_TETTS|nr:amine-terminal domain cyclin [Tetrahymena thermophila SB210]EAR88041.2 amine-terminal domain cyclin [Tetrahymena thermophila SB210]|eukprot:XP_001008286.2 amine-terminal domain cyclin [Tetrahymena thermophila SB210]